MKILQLVFAMQRLSVLAVSMLNDSFENYNVVREGTIFYFKSKDTGETEFCVTYGELECAYMYLRDEPEVGYRDLKKRLKSIVYNG